MFPGSHCVVGFLFACSCSLFSRSVHNGRVPSRPIVEQSRLNDSPIWRIPAPGSDGSLRVPLKVKARPSYFLFFALIRETNFEFISKGEILVNSINATNRITCEVFGTTNSFRELARNREIKIITDRLQEQTPGYLFSKYSPLARMLGEKVFCVSSSILEKNHSPPCPVPGQRQRGKNQ